MDFLMRTLQKLEHLLIVLLISTSQNNNVELLFHKGFYTNNIKDGQIVYPTKVTLNPDISYNLTTFHHEHAGPLLINVTILEKSHILELTPVNHFLATHAIVERHKRDTRSRSKLKPESTWCHYHGMIKGHSTSKVAVSTCNGLTGMITTNSGYYWIEPYHHHENKIEPFHKHIIYKRSTAIYTRDNKRSRKKQKPAKNCGTRQHPRIGQIDWERPIETANAKEKQRTRTRLQNKQRSKKPVGRKRSVRSVSTAVYVETLVVADQSMVEFHQDGDIETYLLTIMNMVSSLYLDPSIGNLINVVVVKIILLDDPVTEPALNVTTKADVALKNFCKWQNAVNPPDDSDPYHHDAAILITRKDICVRQEKPCNTLGVAHIGGMCDLKKSCSVNEDSGIYLAHTIAHELGHNFGMYHDSEKMGCRGKEGDIAHVMTPSFEIDSVGVIWSSCSRREVTSFLDKGLGICLEDNPQKSEDYLYPHLPAGAMYNSDMQCWLQFGVESKVCTSSEEMCHRLWCEVNGTCVTRMHPAAPGTQCGKHKWCQNLNCVAIKDPSTVIDGGWGEWGAWSECSRTCGAGVSIMQRECDHPTPTAGGRFCLGERKRYRICNTSPCPDDQPSFRATQCTRFNNQPFNGQLFTWSPFFNKDEPCELYCMNSNNTVITPRVERVSDGTPCNLGRRDMCISGICKKVGCDWVVDSIAEEDECGVCQGDGKECDRMEGMFIEEGAVDDYKLFATIPKGARNVFVEEVEQTENYLAIADSSGKKFYLNDKSQNTAGGERTIAGTQALYEKEHNLEKVKIPGPLKDAISLYVVFQGNTSNPGVKYQYTLPKHQTKRVQYMWILDDWSQCSATCGGGIEVQVPLCQESITGALSNVIDGTASAVDESSCDPFIRPKQRHRSCNTEPCHTEWWIGPWQSCSVTCGYKGGKAMRRRSIMCADENQMALPDQYCERSTKPKEYEPCKALPLCAED